MSEKVLSVEDVTMQFGGVVAVNNLSLEVHKGEIVSLIGPNGAGKTTAFNVITGVYAPTNGSVEFEGKNIISNYPRGKMEKLYAGEHKGKYKKVLEPTPDKITKLGIARTFQNIRLFKNLTVLENVLIAKHMRMKANVFADTFLINWKEEKKMKEDALELLRILDLYELKDEKSSSLPYGKQRHLEIARALATTPSLLLLDEPAAGLNPQETDELTDFIRKVRDQFHLTVFMIEHHMNLVMDISDRIYVIDFGKMIANGTPNEIQNNQRVIDAYLGVAEDE
ncbi:lipopolysaccharide export system ATP-binding protein LptB [Anaerotignum neopropionicum]|uniref:Lipopolysaccharide export system ATP-binding protein LptB n=1 Tax=Anaerotignum neopropionicum TaxID=36847 RepID=A0A136WHL6_9FIRM|nr:ABC transporter ATP-binding protein [Anaerotignum neopropionicum]KXL53977.1 lipopolysaccharide export system ATP-binding protein LptB [Anaerotignum neopropionicum]